MRRFMGAYRESLAYMFSDPRAVKLYAESVGATETLVNASIERFQLKKGKQLDSISGVDALMQEGVKVKLLDRPLTKEQLAELIQILPPN